MENKLPTSLNQFFLHFIKPYKWYMISLLFTGFFWGIQTSLSPYFLKLMIDAIASDDGNRQLVQ